MEQLIIQDCIKSYITNITIDTFDFTDYFNNVILPILVNNNLYKNRKQCIDNWDDLYDNNVNIKNFNIRHMYNTRHYCYNVFFQLRIINDLNNPKIKCKLQIETEFVFFSSTDIQLFDSNNSEYEKTEQYPYNIPKRTTIIKKTLHTEVNELLIDYIKSLLLNYVNKDVCNIIIDYNDKYSYLLYMSDENI